MSWAEVKKAINSDLSTPLNSKIDSQTTALNKSIKFTKSTAGARSALAALGFTQRMTMTAPDGTTIYGYWKNASVKSCSWDEAKEICDNYWKEINNWANEQGYGNICIFSRMPAYTDTGSWLPSGETWTGSQHNSNNNHYYWSRSSYSNNGDIISYQCVPVVLII